MSNLTIFRVFQQPAKTLFILAQALFIAVSSAAFAGPFPEYARLAPDFHLRPPKDRPAWGLEKGKMLAAGRNITDSIFSKSVILLIEYNWYGSIGLIINRPTMVEVSSALPELKAFEGRKDLIYLGGPVEAGRKMTFLIRSSLRPGGARHIFGDVYSGSGRDDLRYILDNGDRLRVYAGYAGWAPGQLEREVLRGDWHIFGADEGFIFEKNPSGLWEELMRRR